MAETYTVLNLRYLARIYTQERIAKMSGCGLTQELISEIIHGKKYLKLSQAQAIELSFGIPNGWLRKYPIAKLLALLHEIKKMCPDAIKWKLAHRLLEIALDNTPQRSGF